MKVVKFHIAKKLQFAPYRAKKIFPYDTKRYIYVRVNKVNVTKYQVHKSFTFTDTTSHTLEPPTVITDETNLVEVYGNYYHNLSKTETLIK